MNRRRRRWKPEKRKTIVVTRLRTCDIFMPVNYAHYARARMSESFHYLFVFC